MVILGTGVLGNAHTSVQILCVCVCVCSVEIKTMYKTAM